LLKRDEPVFREKPYANNTILKKHNLQHYAHNRFSRKTGLVNFFKNIKSGHFINVQLSKKFFETQTPFLYPPFYLEADFGVVVYIILPMIAPLSGSFLLFDAHSGIISRPHLSSFVS